MKPVAIVQHDSRHRPGQLIEFPGEIGVDSRLFRAGEGVPCRAGDFSGLVVLGNSCKVKDDDEVDREILLVRHALACGIPVMGHGFGGHLLARALGSMVSSPSRPTIGWHPLHVTPTGRAWFGGAARVMCFNWHERTFAIPKGASRALFGTHCLNEGFSIDKHLALQCHLEVTEEVLRDWCVDLRSMLSFAQRPAIVLEGEVLARLSASLPWVHQAARAVYRKWTQNLARPPMVQLHVGQRARRGDAHPPKPGRAARHGTRGTERR